MSMFSDQRQAETPAFRGLRRASVSESKVWRRMMNGPTTSVLHLKVVGMLPDPALVQDHHVPVVVWDRGGWGGEQWDLTTQQVLPYIDGYNHIAKIAAAADVENNLVKACVENLVYYGQVRLLPIFQYSNMYVVTPAVQKLYSSPHLQEECQRAVAKTPHPPPQLSHILQLYCSMTYGVKVRDLCLRLNPQSLNIDERRLIQFGLLHSLIRCLHCYPILLPPTSTTQSTPWLEDLSSAHRPTTKQSVIHSMCTGQFCYDEICCKFGLTHKELHERMERDPNITLIWK